MLQEYDWARESCSDAKLHSSLFIAWQFSKIVKNEPDFANKNVSFCYIKDLWNIQISWIDG